MRLAFKTALVLAVLVVPARLLACATCYGGDIDSPMTNGMNWGIFTLLAVIVPVLGVFLTFLIYAIRKSEAVEAAARKNSLTTEV